MPRGPMGGRRAVEEPHDFGKVMGKLVNYCRNYLPVIIIALILGAAGTVCQIVGPDKLKDMTNEIVKGLPAIVNGRPVMNSVDFGTVGHIAWTLVALYVGYAVLGYVQSWMMANVTQRTAQRLRESISVKSTNCRSNTSTRSATATCCPASPTMWTPSARRWGSRSAR